MPPALHTPAPRDDRWPHTDPRYDRAAGAWLGAAFATVHVPAPRDALATLAHADGQLPGPARLAWLIDTALRDVRAAGTVAATVREAPERAWAAALRHTVARGELAAPDGAVSGVGALATGWRATWETPVPRLDPARGVFPCHHLGATVRRAHAEGGYEAAMWAGALAGARWGASGVPLGAHRLMCAVVDPEPSLRRCVVLARGSDPATWPEQEHHFEDRADCVVRPFSVRHPFDPGVRLGNVSHMRVDTEARAVVSLCRLGAADVPAHLPAADHVRVWLIDTDDANPNLHFVCDEAARVVAALRGEGKRVLLHCAAGQSRTPAVAAHYAALSGGVDVLRALRTIIAAAGGHLDTPELSRAVAALNGVALHDPVRELFPEGVPPRRG